MTIESYKYDILHYLQQNYKSSGMNRRRDRVIYFIEGREVTISNDEIMQYYLKGLTPEQVMGELI